MKAGHRWEENPIMLPPTLVGFFCSDLTPVSHVFEVFSMTPLASVESEYLLPISPTAPDPIAGAVGFFKLWDRISMYLS